MDDNYVRRGIDPVSNSNNFGYFVYVDLRFIDGSFRPVLLIKAKNDMTLYIEYGYLFSWVFFAFIMHDICNRLFGVLQYKVSLWRKIGFYLIFVLVLSNPFVAPFILTKVEKYIANYE